MRLLYPLFLSGGVSAILAPRSTLKARYIEPQVERVVNNHFMVKLADDHPLEHHFANIELDLRDIATEFGYWEQLDMYHFALAEHNSTLIHEVIRHDVGVEYIGHNHYMDPTNAPELVASSHKPATHLQKETGQIRPLEGDDRPDSFRSRVPAKRNTWKQWTTVKYPEAPWNYAFLTRQTQLKNVRPTYFYEIEHVADPGEGVQVYVFDGGVKIDHKVFNGRARNFKDLGMDEQSPYCEEGETMFPDSGHGTAVASVISQPNYGLAYNATIVSVRCFCNGSTAKNWVQAMVDVQAEHEDWRKNPEKRPSGWKGSVGVITMRVDESWEPFMTPALDALVKSGVPMAASGGNLAEDRKNQFKLSIPGRGPNVLSCGAIDINYNRWDGSVHNGDLNLFAPGVDISVANWDTQDGMMTFTGSSLAAPHAAGVMALMVGFEGINDDGTKIIDRVKANLVPLVNEDAEMKAQGTRLWLLNTGIAHPSKLNPNYPYNLPINHDELKRGTESSKENERVATRQLDLDWFDKQPSRGPTINLPAGPRPNIPENPVSNILDDEVKALPAKEPSINCHDVDTRKYLDAPTLGDIIDNQFCAEAERRDSVEPLVGSFSQTYYGRSMDEVTLTIEWLPSFAYRPRREVCTKYMRQLMDSCDKPGESSNPNGYKAGGRIIVEDGVVTYRIDPQTERQTAGLEPHAGCKIDIGAIAKVTDVKVWIWGNGWAASDFGEHLKQTLAANDCGKGKAEGWKFEYKLESDEGTSNGLQRGKEFTMYMQATDVADKGVFEEKCLAKAVEDALGPKGLKCDYSWGAWRIFG